MEKGMMLGANVRSPIKKNARSIQSLLTDLTGFLGDADIVDSIPLSRGLIYLILMVILTFPILFFPGLTITETIGFQLMHTIIEMVLWLGFYLSVPAIAPKLIAGPSDHIQWHKTFGVKIGFIMAVTMLLIVLSWTFLVFFAVVGFAAFVALYFLFPAFILILLFNQKSISFSKRVKILLVTAYYMIHWGSIAISSGLMYLFGISHYFFLKI